HQRSKFRQRTSDDLILFLACIRLDRRDPRPGLNHSGLHPGALIRAEIQRHGRFFKGERIVAPVSTGRDALSLTNIESGYDRDTAAGQHQNADRKYNQILPHNLLLLIWAEIALFSTLCRITPYT